MNPGLAEDLLRAVVGNTANGADFPDRLGVLRRLAMYKYDEYQQYAPGRQFIECLALWLEQFSDEEERSIALQFIEHRLIYISDAEMRHFVTLMARDHVPLALQRLAAAHLAVPQYRLATIRNSSVFRQTARSSLFLGMSDGARIDQFRRNSTGLSNEQFAMTYELSDSRVEAMTRALHRDSAESERGFECVFLIDDFAGSGTTILRNDPATGLDGKLVRFINDTLPKLTTGTCPKIFILLYVITEQALKHLHEMLAAYDYPKWTSDNVPEIIGAMIIGDNARLYHSRDDEGFEADKQFDSLLHKFYDPTVEDEHKGEVLHGFADCGLPLVLSHNTPNNSLYLLWEKERTRPLFPRTERHHSRLREE